MSENQYNKKTENRGKNLVDITNEYNENERPQDESESVLDEAVDKVKAGTKAVINKVKDTDKTLVPNIIQKKQIKLKIRTIKGYRGYLMNFLGYLSFLLAVIITISFILCLAAQQIVTYHTIIEKARKFANNKHSLKN